MSQPRVTVFRSRLRSGSEREYHRWANDMERLAREMPGFVDFKSFTAADGERVSIIVFDSDASHAAWRDHPEHRKAQALGRTDFYDEYRIQVCDLVHDHHFTRAD
jgi:heme-degrading monooxygenase HmoA